MFYMFLVGLLIEIWHLGANCMQGRSYMKVGLRLRHFLNSAKLFIKVGWMRKGRYGKYRVCPFLPIQLPLGDILILGRGQSHALKSFTNPDFFSFYIYSTPFSQVKIIGNLCCQIKMVSSTGLWVNSWCWKEQTVIYTSRKVLNLPVAAPRVELMFFFDWSS